MFYLEDHESIMNDKISEVKKIWNEDKDKDVVDIIVGEPYFEAEILNVEGGRYWFDPIQSIERIDNNLFKINYHFNDQILSVGNIKRMVINLIYPITIIHSYSEEGYGVWEELDTHGFEYMVLIGE